ncbi:MAG: 5'-methylthioadenosine/adenosylhomocysteine nucleosidase [Gemmataceae bacterium]
MTIGIMSAMREEIQCLLGELRDLEVSEAGMRTYHKGTLWGTPVALVFSRWGKVAAATTATYLIEHFGVSRMIFTGVAGGIDESLHVGDVVVASQLVQHDMNASPLYPRHEIPLLGVVRFPTDPALRHASLDASRTFLSDDFQPQVAAEFHIRRPKVVEGLVASGDRFFANREDRTALQGTLPGVACVEMEGAAVAQVCHEYSVPAVVIRTISDAADEGAPADFPKFVRQIASTYSHGILKRLLPILRHHSRASDRPA